MNTLIILDKIDQLTQSNILFNNAYYENAWWEIKDNVLHFTGEKIQDIDGWGGIITKKEELLEIEDRFIQERSKGFWRWRRKEHYVTGQHILKERLHREIKTSLWTIINKNQTGLSL